MTDGRIKILGISGSLRSSSAATALLKQVCELMPAEVEFSIYEELEKIPAFDDGRLILVPEAHLIKRIQEVDCVFFCIPEYAHGVPRAIKNAIDWTVSSTVFTNKPVAVITAATSGERAHESFTNTLKAIGANLPPASSLLISFVRTKLDVAGKVSDPELLHAIESVIKSLLKEC